MRIKLLERRADPGHVPDYTDPATGKKGRIDFNRPFPDVLLDAVELAARILYRRRYERYGDQAQEMWDALIGDTYMYACRRIDAYDRRYSVYCFAAFCCRHVSKGIEMRYNRLFHSMVGLDGEEGEKPVERTQTAFTGNPPRKTRKSRDLKEEYEDYRALMESSALRPASFTGYVDSQMSDEARPEFRRTREWRDGHRSVAGLVKRLGAEGYRGTFPWIAGRLPA